MGMARLGMARMGGRRGWVDGADGWMVRRGEWRDWGGWTARMGMATARMVRRADAEEWMARLGMDGADADGTAVDGTKAGIGMALIGVDGADG